MNDLGIYQFLETQLHQMTPQLTVYGQTISNMNLPYAVLKLGLLEQKKIPQKIAVQKVALALVSRYKGEAEIQTLEQRIRTGLEGIKLKLPNNVSGMIVWDESQICLEKDNITRTAHLHFTIRLKFL